MRLINAVLAKNLVEKHPSMVLEQRLCLAPYLNVNWRKVMWCIVEIQNQNL